LFTKQTNLNFQKKMMFTIYTWLFLEILDV